MRIDLVLQRLHAGMQQQALLLLQFDLNAHAVPDFEFRTNHHDRGRVDQQFDPPGRTFQAKGRMRGYAVDFEGVLRKVNLSEMLNPCARGFRVLNIKPMN